MSFLSAKSDVRVIECRRFCLHVPIFQVVIRSFSGFLSSQIIDPKDPNKATKVEGQRGKSLDFPGARTTGPKLQPTPGSNAASSVQSTTRWTPPYNRSPYTDDNELVFRRVRGVLNKLTPDKFDKLFYDLLNVGIETKYILKGVILLVFEKALDEPKYSSMYAQLCLRLSEEAPNFDDPGKTGNSTFRRLLLKQCEEEFNNRSKASQAFDKKDGPFTQEEEEQRCNTKRKMLGNIRFIGELAKFDMLHETILHRCIKQLLDKKKRASLADTSEDMECLCHLMKTVGPRIDVLKAKPLVDQYFERIKQIMERPDLPARIRFMMQDVLELREHKWIPRKAVQDVAPKTIYQIRQEAWQDFGHSGPKPMNNPPMPRNSPPHHSINWQGRPNYGAKVPTHGRGLNDVFIREKEERTLFDHEYGNGNVPDPQRSFGLRYDEDDYDSFTPRDPWATLASSHSPQRGSSPNASPPVSRHQHYGNRRPPTRPSPLNTDGEISLRPAKDSMAAKTLGMAGRVQNQSKMQDAMMKSKAPPIIEKPKPKKPQGPSKADIEKQMDTILLEYLSNKEDSTAIKSVKSMKAEKHSKDLLLQVLLAGVNRNDEERLLIAQLVQAMHKEGLVSTDNIIQGMRDILEDSNYNEGDKTNTNEYFSGLAARTVIQGIVTLSEVSKMLDGEKFLQTLLLVLKKLEQMNGQEWLIGAFNESKINLMNYLPEQDRCNEKMMEILDEQSLSFLFPLLRIQSELYKKIEEDPNSSNIYKWIKENIDLSLQSQPDFVSVLSTCILKFATHDSTMGKGVDRTQSPDKDLVEKEKSAMKKIKPLLDQFLHEKIDLQVRALYSLQVFCHTNSFPKGLLLRMFMLLYDLEIVEEEAFVKWKEDVNDDYPGKGRALFQVNTWLTWLETADEEGSESEPE